MSGRGWAVVAGLLFSAAAVSSVSLGFRAEWAHVRAAEQRCEELETRLERLRSLRPRLPEIQREIGTLNEQHGQLDLMLPTPDDAERELVEEIERRGLRVVSIEGSENNEIDADHRWQEFDLRLQAVGRSWIDPLDALVYIPMLVSMDSIDVHDPRDPESIIELRVYVVVQR